MDETTHSRFAGFPVIDEAGFDRFEWRHGEDGFDDASAETGEYGAGAGDIPGFVGEEIFETVEGEEADAGFNRVADDEGCAAGIPFRAEFGPMEVRVIIVGVGQQ